MVAFRRPTLRFVALELLSYDQAVVWILPLIMV
jgi:hypothetical protein